MPSLHFIAKPCAEAAAAGFPPPRPRDPPVGGRPPPSAGPARHPQARLSCVAAHSGCRFVTGSGQTSLTPPVPAQLHRDTHSSNPMDARDTRHTTHVYRRHAKAVSQRGGSSPQGAGPGAPGQVAAGTRRRSQASRLAPPAVGAHRCLPRARPDATVSAQTQHEGLGHRGGPAGGGDLDIACCCQRVQARPSSQHVSSASDGESATLRALCPSGWGRADSPPG